jgi:hypothetical protein
MMGRQRRDQGKLFYAFRLDDRIPKNHLLRRIDLFVTALADLHKGGHDGWPSQRDVVVLLPGILERLVAQHL